MSRVVVALILLVLLLVGIGFLFVDTGSAVQDDVNEALPEPTATTTVETASAHALPELGAIPDLELTQYDGGIYSLSQVANKVLIINSWAAWCPFCVQELPDLAELQEMYPNQILVIAVDRRERLSIAKEFTDKHNVTDRLVLLLDPTDAFYKAIGGSSMPETIFVDTDGTIRIHKRGVMSLEEMIEKTELLLSM